jgi:crotonobetainyl-CoA:carnitine CoA-transferase CaiB-like acyl-CoA transferase
MPGPLSEITILDLTTVGFGPYGAQILGDYGAEVIKVEAPEGDITRTIAPFRHAGMGHFFLNANRNKRCIVLDLKQPKGRDALLRLVADADALLTSIRPAAMERLGLGYEACCAVNPRLVYVSLVGFGQNGPYGPRPAYDDIIQGLSGMAQMQGGKSGVPRYINASICDKIGSQFAVHATIAALFSRERTGDGQHVEVPMLESLVGFNLVEHQAGQTFEPALGPAGYERSMVEYRRPYATADGFVCVLPYNVKQWRAFFALMQRPEMLDDPRVTDGKLRSEKIGELYEMVAECVRDWRTEELLQALEKADIPNGRAVPLGELADDPHLQAVGLFRHLEHPSEGPIRLAGPGVRFSKTPAEVRSLPARLGEHSVDILREAGFSDDEIAQLLDDGVTLDGSQSGRRVAAE